MRLSEAREELKLQSYMLTRKFEDQNGQRCTNARGLHKRRISPQWHQLGACVAAIPAEHHMQRRRGCDGSHNAHVEALRLQLWPYTTSYFSPVFCVVGSNAPGHHWQHESNSKITPVLHVHGGWGGAGANPSHTKPSNLQVWFQC